jgi:DNA-binding GntR family transcriptional regulator
MMDNTEKNSRAEEAFIKLQDAIISGKLRPNQRLVEQQLSEEFGMSRTPLREAIRQLQQMGHLTVLPSGGVIVTEFSPKHIKDMFEVREALETMVIKLDCGRATDEQLAEARQYLDHAAEAAAARDIDEYGRCNTAFHDTLLEACGNDKLISMVKTIRDQYYLRRLAMLMTDAELRRMMKQHYSIMDALDRRSEAAAQRAFRELIRGIAKIAINRL